MNEILKQEETNVVELESFFKEELYSPYQLCKVVNKILESLQINKILPPQMFYTYVRSDKKYIVCDENKKITKEECIRFTSKYIQKNFS